MTSATFCPRLDGIMIPVSGVQHKKATRLRIPGVNRHPSGTCCVSSNSLSSSDETLLAKMDLLDCISGTERGLKCSNGIKNRILKTVEALRALGAASVTTDESLSGTWELLWTTEKETLFIFDKASLFGTAAGDTFQPIDVRKNTLLNVITFPPSGSFEVQASIGVASAQRIDFKFTGAKLTTPKRVLNLPPFGKGWFDNVYLDHELRISMDSRGDTLVTRRAGFDWFRKYVTL